MPKLWWSMETVFEGKISKALREDLSRAYPRVTTNAPIECPYCGNIEISHGRCIGCGFPRKEQSDG